MIITVTVNLWWPIGIIGGYYLIGLVLSVPMVLVSLAYPRPEWRRTLIGWLVVGWIAPIAYASAYGHRFRHRR
jgi:hypothetical protein